MGRRKDPGSRLFPREVERIEGGVLEGLPVPVGCRTEAVYATDATNRDWVLKKLISAPGMCAEAVGWILARQLGIPVPDGAAVPGAKGASPPWIWASRREPSLVHWDPDLADRIVNLDQFAAVVMLDAWLGNGDRHDQNITCRQRADGSLELLAIDYDAASVGDAAERALLRCAPPKATPIHPPPVNRWRPHVAEWVARGRAVSTGSLQRVAVEACELAGLPDVRAVSSWLLERLRLLPDLTASVADYYERSEA